MESLIKVAQRAIITNNDGKILAVRRSLTDARRPGSWDLPGGALEVGEDVWQAICREVWEETGITITPESLTLRDVSSHDTEWGQFWVDVLYSVSVKDPEVVLSDEHLEYAWLTRAELLEKEISDTVRAFLERTS